MKREEGGGGGEGPRPRIDKEEGRRKRKEGRRSEEEGRRRKRNKEEHSHDVPQFDATLGFIPLESTLPPSPIIINKTPFLRTRYLSSPSVEELGDNHRNLKHTSFEKHLAKGCEPTLPPYMKGTHWHLPQNSREHPSSLDCLKGLVPLYKHHHDVKEEA
mgnify:CR=1 FL=1